MTPASHPGAIPRTGYGWLDVEDTAGATNLLLVTLLVPASAILLGVAFLGVILPAAEGRVGTGHHRSSASLRSRDAR